MDARKGGYGQAMWDARTQFANSNAAYLNLIEKGKRVTPFPLLWKALRYFQVDPENFMTQLSEGRVDETLAALLQDPLLKTLDLDFQEQLLKLAQARKTAYLTVGHGELSDVPRAGKNSADNPARTGNIIRTLLTRQNYQVKDLGAGQAHLGYVEGRQRGGGRRRELEPHAVPGRQLA